MIQWFLRAFQRNHITVSSDMADIHFAFGAKLLPAEVTLNIFEDKIQGYLSNPKYTHILSNFPVDIVCIYVDIISIYYAGVDKCHAALKSTLKSMFNVFKFQHVCKVVTPSWTENLTEVPPLNALNLQWTIVFLCMSYISYIMTSFLIFIGMKFN